jgi:hypothetical protein
MVAGARQALAPAVAPQDTVGSRGRAVGGTAHDPSQVGIQAASMAARVKLQGWEKREGSTSEVTAAVHSMPATIIADTVCVHALPATTPHVTYTSSQAGSQ